MSNKPCELRDDELALITGGSERIFSSIQLGLTPGHRYGLASDTFGQGLSFQEASKLLNEFNAPSRDALYGSGNDPNASWMVLSRPGAQDLGYYLDFGGIVTVQHGDGYAVNTTVPGLHWLEGTASRNLVVDLNEGGGYQGLTLGRGDNGAALATAVGTLVGREIAGPPGGVVGGIGGQNSSHFLNPELAHIAFSQVDDAMIAAANGTRNPNLDAPSGRSVEAGYLAAAAIEGYNIVTGHGATGYGNSEQQHTVYGLGRTLNEQGPVTGYFMQSSVGPGVYHVTPEGMKYYELVDGKIVEQPIDEFRGLDQAIARQAELNGQTPQQAPAGEINVELPPEVPGLPPELAPRDSGNNGDGSPGDSGNTYHRGSNDSGTSDAYARVDYAGDSASSDRGSVDYAGGSMDYAGGGMDFGGSDYV